MSDIHPPLCRHSCTAATGDVSRWRWWLFVVALGRNAQGWSRGWIGGSFLIATVLVYAGIGLAGPPTRPSTTWPAAACRPCTTAWRPRPTGCLVALLVAPHLRKLGLYTVPDYFDLRFGGRWPRLIAAFAAVLCSFTYVVAQIYGVGLIASRLTGVQFEIGILLGLGGVLLCSFLGGMRAITWTQVAQYVILLLAFLIPVSWLAYKQLGNPLAPLVYGKQIEKITELEKALVDSPAEKQVRAVFAQREREYQARLSDVDAALRRERAAAQERLRQLKARDADSALIVAASRDLAAVPKDADSARELWTRAMAESHERAKPLGGLPHHAQAFVGDPKGSPQAQALFETSRLNHLALMFCLMLGTAGLPHVLTRYYTTPSVSQARSSVGGR
jgi:cation/acetate symporter